MRYAHKSKYMLAKCKHVHSHLHMNTHMLTLRYVHTHPHAHTFLHICTNIWTHTHTHTPTYTPTWTNTHTYTHTNPPTPPPHTNPSHYTSPATISAPRHSLQRTQNTPAAGATGGPQTGGCPPARHCGWSSRWWSSHPTWSQRQSSWPATAGEIVTSYTGASGKRRRVFHVRSEL